MRIGELSDKDLSKILQLVKEILSNSYHDFSLLAIKNSSGQYLQKYDKGWESWLFPYVRSSENNKENIDSFASEILNEEIKTEYISNTKHCKFSISDNVYKIYNHKLYRVVLDSIPDNMNSKTFMINEDKYSWMSIKDMETDKRIMEVNDDVVAFVKIITK